MSELFSSLLRTYYNLMLRWLVPVHTVEQNLCCVRNGRTLRGSTKSRGKHRLCDSPRVASSIRWKTQHIMSHLHGVASRSRGQQIHALVLQPSGLARCGCECAVYQSVQSGAMTSVKKHRFAGDSRALRKCTQVQC